MLDIKQLNADIPLEIEAYLERVSSFNKPLSKQSEHVVDVVNLIGGGFWTYYLKSIKGHHGGESYDSAIEPIIKICLAKYRHMIGESNFVPFESKSAIKTQRKPLIKAIDELIKTLTSQDDYDAITIDALSKLVYEEQLNHHQELESKIKSDERGRWEENFNFIANNQPRFLDLSADYRLSHTLQLLKAKLIEDHDKFNKSSDFILNNYYPFNLYKTNVNKTQHVIFCQMLANVQYNLTGDFNDKEIISLSEKFLSDNETKQPEEALRKQLKEIKTSRI